MGMYIDGKLSSPPENKEADRANKAAVEQWQKDHANDKPIEPVFDEATGRQVNYFDRTEVVVHDELTFKVTQYFDGTIRKDNRMPAAPRPKPVTVDSEIRYSPEDRQAMRASEILTAQATEQGIVVTDHSKPKEARPNWLNMR